MTAVAGRERDGLPVIDLVMRPRNNDKQAWDALVERYAPLIWSICIATGWAARTRRCRPDRLAAPGRPA